MSDDRGTAWGFQCFRVARPPGDYYHWYAKVNKSPDVVLPVQRVAIALDDEGLDEREGHWSV